MEVVPVDVKAISLLAFVAVSRNIQVAVGVKVHTNLAVSNDLYAIRWFCVVVVLAETSLTYAVACHAVYFPHTVAVVGFARTAFRVLAPSRRLQTASVPNDCSLPV